jgi:hypothetical protein
MDVSTEKKLALSYNDAISTAVGTSFAGSVADWDNGFDDTFLDN